MSDGNYNRNLLPYRNYASGVRAGRASELQRALKTLDSLLLSEGVISDGDKRKAFIDLFHKLMAAQS